VLDADVVVEEVVGLGHLGLRPAVAGGADAVGDQTEEVADALIERVHDLRAQSYLSLVHQ